MGFPSFLKEVQDQGRTVTLDYLKNKRICVDGYNFLFNMVRPVAYQVMVLKQKDRLFDMFKRMLDPLMRVCRTVYLVWDGRQLPCKAITSGDRIQKREECLQKGLAMLEKDEKDAIRLIRRGFHVPQEDIAVLNEQLSQRYERNECAFTCFTAPYEADQQMAFMARQGIADTILSNDSDMLMYGVDLVREWNEFGEHQGTRYGADVLKSVLERSKMTFEEYLFQRITMTCDYYPYQLHLEQQGASKYMSLNEYYGRYGSQGRLVQTLICSLYQFFYQLVFDFKQNKVVPMNVFPAKEQSLLPYLPTNVIGTAKNVEIVLNQNQAQVALLLRRINFVKQQTTRGPFNYSVFTNFKVEANASIVEIFGLKGDIDCNSIYEDYLRDAPEKLAAKFIWQPKQHRVKVEPQKRDEWHSYSSANADTDVSVNSDVYPVAAK